MCVVCVAARVLLELTELASSLVCLGLLLVLCMPFFSVFVVARLWRSTAAGTWKQQLAWHENVKTSLAAALSTHSRCMHFPPQQEDICMHAYADTSETCRLGAISTCQATYMTTSTCIVDMRQSARRDLHAWRGGPCVPPLACNGLPSHDISTYKRAVCWDGSVVVYLPGEIHTDIWTSNLAAHQC